MENIEKIIDLVMCAKKLKNYCNNRFCDNCIFNRCNEDDWSNMNCGLGVHSDYDFHYDDWVNYGDVPADWTILNKHTRKKEDSRELFDRNMWNKVWGLSN